MSTPLLTPEPQPAPAAPGIAGRLARGFGMLILMAAVAAAASYGVFEWRIRAEQATASTQVTAMREQTLAEVAELRAEMKSQSESLQTDLRRVQESAEAVGLLMQKDGEVTGLQSRLAEIETLKLELRKTQEELEGKLKGLEQSVKDQVARSGQQTAEELSLEMKVKSLLIKAQGEILLTQMHWAEGNRGLARDELAIAHRTLQQALAEAPESAKPSLKKVADAAEQTKASLILEVTSARDSLNLLWHQVSELLGAAVKP